MQLFYTLLCFLFVLQATAQPFATPDDVYAQMSLAYQKLDADLIKPIYHADAQYLSPGAKIRRGVPEFIDDFTNMFASARTGNTQLKISFAIQNRRQLTKKTVLDVGVYTLTSTQADGTTGQSQGKFTTVLEKDRKMGWQFTVDTYNDVPRPPQIEPASSRIPEDIIRGNIKQFSKDLVAGDYAAVTAAYTADGKIFPNQLPILTGRSAIEKYWTPAADNPNQIIFHEIIPELITVHGRQAVDYGYYRGKTRNGAGEESTWQGKYVIVWQEVDLGVWKIKLDIWNSVRDATVLSNRD